MTEVLVFGGLFKEIVQSVLAGDEDIEILDSLGLVAVPVNVKLPSLIPQPEMMMMMLIERRKSTSYFRAEGFRQRRFNSAYLKH